MRLTSFLIAVFLAPAAFCGPDNEWLTPFEKSKGKASASYDECMSYYQKLDLKYDEIILYQSDGKFFNERGRSVYKITGNSHKNNPGKLRIFINNAIHAGEPDGVDASMMLVRDLLQKKELIPLLERIEFYVIPIYNVDGYLERGCCSRANQDGPELYGFRANGQNYDLNRDFIKADAPETHFFQESFRKAEPHIFIDTHVSNGADYQYVMTYIAAHRAKLHPSLARVMYEYLIPGLHKNLGKKGAGIAPYVNVFGSVPDSGYNAFFESPRYASGYATLFNSMGFVTETHMLKPFKERVEATYGFLLELTRIASEESDLIISMKTIADNELTEQRNFTVAWKHDPLTYSLLPFKGYAAAYRKSEVSGEQRLFYDRKKPYEKSIRYYDNYESSVVVEKPIAYIIPSTYRFKLEPHLKRNRVIYSELERDTTFKLAVYSISNYQTLNRPYEGHYLHHSVIVTKDTADITVRKGSLIIHTKQSAARYIVETLEPAATDAFFAWNYFDAILQQKEHYSDYVWEDKAAELLKNNAVLRNAFEKKKKDDPAFAKSASAQLDYIYRNSKYSEKVFQRYPVYRLEF